MSLAEIQVELLRTEYPFLRPDHDPDIERYFDLRAAGRPVDALALYEARLRPRYPDDAFRAAVLKAYRLRDPAYHRYLAGAYAALGSRLLDRTKRTLKYIALRASSYDPSDAYSTIKAAESILAMLPSERFEAIATIERLRRYADRIRYCERQLATAEDLVRAYLTESLEVVEQERSRRKAARTRAAAERRRALVEQDKRDLERDLREERNRREEKDRAVSARRVPERTPPARVTAILDLSRLRFSAADLARIQIPPTLTRIEDKTLAYCFKYWNLVGDPAFERVLFLYSRKYGSKHYEVYAAISRGRKAGRRDEEILSAVSAILITGYYYSIRGDVYLQRNWMRLKAKLESAAPAGAEPPKPAEPAARSARIRKPAAAVLPKSPKIDAAATRRANAASRSEPKAERPEHREDFGRPATEQRRPATEQRRPVAEQLRVGSPGGSVSDRLKKLSGRSYDVYRDRFIAKARPSIRTVLAKRKNAHRGIFATVPEEAEEIVFAFLRDHYADPYMDWEGGSEKKRLAELGFDLESLDPVIEDCFRNLSGK